MTATATINDPAAQAVEMFSHIDDLIQKGCLKLSPASIVTEHAENWVVYTNGITVTVGWAKRAHAALLPPLVHDVLRVSTVARGKFLVNLPGEKRQVGPGETITIDPGTLHNFVALEADSKLVSVYMPREPIMSRLFGKLFKHP